MPCDISGGDGLLHPFPVLWGCLLEILVDHPGGQRPDIALLTTRSSEGLGSTHCARQKVVEVSADNSVLGVRIADVQMAFPKYIYFLDLALCFFSIGVKCRGRQITA